MRTKHYVGLNFGLHMRVVFRYTTTPTKESHSQFNAVNGPFRTKRGATFMAKCGSNNPHCRCVGDAEQLAKKYPELSL